MPETTTARVSIGEAIESLMALQRLYKLAELVGINVQDGNGSVSLRVKSAEDLAAWADALNCGPFGRHVSRYPDRAPIHSAWTASLGWHISVTYYEPELPETQADADVLVAETVAVLNEPKPRHRSLSEKIADANAEAAKFNAAFPPGTKVEYWSGARRGAGKIGHTYGEAFASNSGQAVVFLDNASSYHALSHVKPLVEVVPQPNAEALVSNACTCGHSEPEHISGVCMTESVDEFCPCGSYARATS